MNQKLKAGMVGLAMLVSGCSVNSVKDSSQDLPRSSYAVTASSPEEQPFTGVYERTFKVELPPIYDRVLIVNATSDKPPQVFMESKDELAPVVSVTLPFRYNGKDPQSASTPDKFQFRIERRGYEMRLSDFCTPDGPGKIVLPMPCIDDRDYFNSD